MSLNDSFLEDGLLVSELAKPLKEIYIAIRTDSKPGDGTRENPFDGSTAKKFDQIFFDFRAFNVRFRLGPGIFRTEGADATFATRPLLIFSGCHITGAGMFNTILRLTAASSGNQTTFRHIDLIGKGSNSVNDVEISDLTIDCNLDDQIPTFGLPYALMSIDAVSIDGANNRFRRVRVINFGNRTPTIRNGVNTLVDSQESWPFFLPGTNVVLEDCVLEKPIVGSGRETTTSAISGPFSAVRNNFYDGAFTNPDNGFSTVVDSITVIPGTPKSTIKVRTRYPHNVWVKKNDPRGRADWIELIGSELIEFNGRWEVTAPLIEDATSRDLEFQLASPSGTPSSKTITVRQCFAPTMRIKQASWAGNLITIETGTDHWRKVGDWVVVSGADIVSNIDLFNGSYQVVNVIGAKSFQVSRPGSSLPTPTGEMWLDRRPSSQNQRVSNVEGSEDDFWTLWGNSSLSAFSMAESLFKLTFYGPHYRLPGEYITLRIYGPNYDTPYDGYFGISEVLSRNELLVDYTQGKQLYAPSPSIGRIAYDNFRRSSIGNTYQAISCNAESGNLMERNRIVDFLTGGDYHDSYSHLDSIVRKNYYYNVVFGVYHTLNRDTEDFNINATVTGISGSLITCTATLTPSNGLLPGVIIKIFGVGTYGEIVSSSLTGFSFKNPSGSFTINQAIIIRAMTQQRRLIVEDNIFDMSLILYPPDVLVNGTPQAIVVSDNLLIPGGLYVCKDFIVERNYIRTIDNRTDLYSASEKSTSALQAYGCARVLVRHNIINGIVTASAVNFGTYATARSKNITSFNNQDNNGVRLKLYNSFPDGGGAAYYIREINDDADDWFLGM
jgi:hypothetical protein